MKFMTKCRQFYQDGKNVWLCIGMYYTAALKNKQNKKHQPEGNDYSCKKILQRAEIGRKLIPIILAVSGIV